MHIEYPAINKLQDDLLQKAIDDTMDEFDVQLHKDFLKLFQKLEHYEELIEREDN